MYYAFGVTIGVCLFMAVVTIFRVKDNRKKFLRWFFETKYITHIRHRRPFTLILNETIKVTAYGETKDGVNFVVPFYAAGTYRIDSVKILWKGETIYDNMYAASVYLMNGDMLNTHFEMLDDSRVIA